MCAKKIDGLEVLAKAAPNARIELTVAQLRSMFRSLGPAEELPQAPPELPRGTRTPTQREAFRMILTLWPKTKITELSKALGLSRAWIYKVLKDVFIELPVTDSEEPRPADSAPYTQELPVVELQEPETLEDYAKLIEKLTNPQNKPNK